MDVDMLSDAALCAYNMGTAAVVADGQDLDIPGARSLQFVVPPPPRPRAVPASPPRLQEQFEDDDPFEGDDDDDAFLGCVGCMFGARSYDKVKAPKFEMMSKLLDDTLFIIPNEATARSIAAFYRNEIHDPILDNGGSMPRWPWHEVYVHITQHMRKNPDVFIAASTELMDDLETKGKKLADQAYAMGDADEFRKTARIVILANKRNEDLRQLNSKRMWGWTENGFRYDSKSGAKLMNLSRIKIT